MLVCTKCLFVNHRGEKEHDSPNIEVHEYEQIDDYVASVKQMVWMINSKLLSSITKLKFL